MEAVVSALAEQHAELGNLLTGLSGADWDAPSRCEGWSVADVVLHLTQTDEMARASVQGRFAEALVELTRGLPPAGSVDDGAALMVARDRGQPGAAVGRHWRAGADGLRQAFTGCDPGRRLTWVAGELSARTLATTRLAETWIHTEDVAAAFAITLAPSDRLWHIARLAWRTLPYAFARADRHLAGPVAFALRSPGGHEWRFADDESVGTVIRGDALELCLVAARRLPPEHTNLQGDGPDAAAVLELVRTYA